MLFNSLNFLVFFPLVTLVYFLIPHKIRYLWLLGSSYYFYMCWNPKYALLMLTSTIITYASGLLVSHADQKSNDRMKRIWVAISFISNLSILFLFKYFDFALQNINRVLSVLGIQLVQPTFSLLLPVGISFYTFQALSYTMDVYRHNVVPERNFLKYALFVSFFPQLVAGPIERSSNLIHQISERHYFDTHRVSRGLCLMLWGYFQKLVIADRAAIFVNCVYNNPKNPDYYGFIPILATILFAFQIYCDFSSYSDIARGAAEVMGFSLMKNFNTPYFSQNVAEFWRRWHISLSSWFRDYLYIPLGGNRKGTFRKYFNLMIVFAVSGLWHGASWTFVIWGMLNGFYQVVGSLTTPIRKRLSGNEEVFSVRLRRMIVTFCLICFSWVFFRANSTTEALLILRNMIPLNPWIFTDGTLLNFGFGWADWLILAISLLVLLGVSTAKYNGVEIRSWYFRQELWFKYLILLIAIFSVLVFGIYGSNYDASQFIYFQF